MKEIKTGTVLLLIVVVFAAFCAGMYIGKQSVGDGVVIMTEKQAVQVYDQTSAAEPASVSKATSATADTTPPTTEQWHIASQRTEDVSETEQQDTRININTATLAELMTLPGIGEVLAQRILDFRESNGAFEKVDDLDMVEGIGKKTLDKLRDLITVGNME